MLFNVTIFLIQIFVQSLLCSSSVQNINLAGKMLEHSQAESREPDYTSTPSPGLDGSLHRLAYPRAKELVLTAAREYFDSSANLTDQSMDLAQ